MNSDFPSGSDSKASAYSAGDPGSIPGLGRSTGEGNGHPLQYSCLGNPKDGGAWWATVHGVAESDTTEGLYFSKITLFYNTASHFSKSYISYCIQIAAMCCSD